MTSDSLIKEEARKLEIASDYFKTLFEASLRWNDERALSRINPCIDSRMNEKLLQEFQKEEIETTPKIMAPLKASGEDGFLALFF